MEVFCAEMCLDVQALHGFALPWHSSARLAGTLRWGFFLSDEKETKESPKGPAPLDTPGGGDYHRVRLSRRPWLRWGHMDGAEILWLLPAPLFDWYLYRQGLTLAQQLFPAAGGQAPGGGNAALPGKGPDDGTTMPAYSVATRAWAGGMGRDSKRPSGPKITLTQVQPRTGGEDSTRRGKAPPLVGLW